MAFLCPCTKLDSHATTMREATLNVVPTRTSAAAPCASKTRPKKMEAKNVSVLWSVAIHAMVALE